MVGLSSVKSHFLRALLGDRGIVGGLWSLTCKRVFHRHGASVRLSALALTTRMRFVGSTTYRLQSRSSLPWVQFHRVELDLPSAVST